MNAFPITVGTMKLLVFVVLVLQPLEQFPLVIVALDSHIDNAIRR